MIFRARKVFWTYEKRVPALSVTEEKMLPCNCIRKWLDFQVFSVKDYKSFGPVSQPFINPVGRRDVTHDSKSARWTSRCCVLVW